MNIIKCQIPNHQEKQITSVCLNKGCTDKRLCCYICIGLIHSSHVDKIVEVEQITNFIQKQSNEQVKFPQSYCYGQLQIIKGLERMNDLTNNLQKIIKEKIEKAKQYHLKQFLQQSSNIQQGTEYWNVLIEGILRYVQADQYLIVPLKQNVGELSKIEAQQIQFIRKEEEKILEIIQSFNQLGKRIQLQFKKIPFELSGHVDDVNQIVISQDGSLIVSGSDDRTVKLWDCKTKTHLETIQNDSSVYRVAISSKKQYLAFRDTKQQIKLIELKTKNVVLTQKEHTDYIRSIIFSQDSQYLLSGGDDNRLIIWDVIKNTKIHCFQTNSWIETIVMSLDNSFVSCICNNGGTIHIWNFQTKKQLIQQEKTHLQGQGLSTSADSTIYISCGSDGLIKIWKLSDSLQNSKTLTLSRSIQAASKSVDKVFLTSDGLHIISICNQEGQINIHHMETGKLIQVLESGTKSDRCAYFSISNDMNTLVSSNSKEKIFRIWARQLE